MAKLLLLSSRLGRAVLALPLLYLSYYCNSKFDRETLVEIIPPILEKGFIPHPTHPVPILNGVFGWKFANDVFRPISVMFSPSTMGFDPLAWWQMVFFLTDLGPVAGELVKDDKRKGLKEEYVPFLLPLMLVMHYGWVYAMFFGETMEGRHYWTWMWQAAPLWIGVMNAILAKTIPTGWVKESNKVFGKGALSLVVAGISMGMWWYVILKSEFSLWEVFVPPGGGWEKEFVVNTRGILQYDLLCSFGGLLVWSFGLMVDLWAAGAVNLEELLGGFAVLAIAGVLGGPGVALLNAWWWREKRLQRAAAVEEKKN
ncbi:hypothetical protein QBC36DRAFT_382572 [Triangularia setosa]|uniref:Uncharacterized protein n=1 Tax=Triangularia setosa TaxID=2587417 RepID=A0AAN6VXA9_9PEZI|nr:hypothetical protein QBC36DRAFT_382572 [Podospora setosa]